MSGVRTGLIGAGGISTRHLPAWLQLDAEVVVYSDHGAEELTGRFGGRAVGSLAELFDECDIVDVVTPTPTHRSLAELALRAGKDVICEKPLARTHEEAVSLVRTARETGGALLPAHVVRFFPEYAALREAVRGGRVGDPAVARYSRTGTFPSWADWFADAEQSGGVVMDLMIHDLDIARWVCGPVVEVYATHAESEDGGSPVSSAHVVLGHAGGAISHVRGVWGRPHTTFATSYHLAGPLGVLEHDTRRLDTWREDLAPVAAGSAAGRGPAAESPYLAELREFTTALTGGPPARVDLADGVVAVDLALAALESIRTGGPVPFVTWTEDLL